MEIEDGKEEASRHRTEDTGMTQERRLPPSPHVDGRPFIRRRCRGMRVSSAQSAECDACMTLQ